MKDGRSMIDRVGLKIKRHPGAPMFSRPDAPLLMMQLVTEVMSGNFPTKVGEFRDLVRQLGMVNLWFFLKCVAGYNGPYDKLTNHLHVDMANFYQDFALEPGARSAVFIPRSHYKSSVVTHGANTWELVRNPDLTIGLGSEKIDRAQEFLSYSAQTFTSNEFFAWLYPEWHVENTRMIDGAWNTGAITLPCKTRDFDKASIKTLSVGGATAGIHVDLLKFDDIVGDSLLNSEHSSGAEMLRIAHWAHSNINTLVNDMINSRTFWTGTRYAIEDPYERVMCNVKTAVGCWDEFGEDTKYRPVPGGRWDVYYRMAIEKGKIVFPEAIKRDVLDEMMVEDPWTFFTQYQNNPTQGGLNEMTTLPVHPCNVDVDERGWFVHFWDSKEQKRVEVRLEDCDVVAGTDPAASEKKMSARTSRSSHVVVARDWENRVFVLKIWADYTRITTVFDWIFNARKLWPMLRVSAVEMQGPFKLLKPLIEEQERVRGESACLVAVSAGSDKDARIRTQMVPFMDKGKFFVNEADMKTFLEEKLAFPGGAKKDVLDATATALAASTRPQDPKEIAEEELYAMIGTSDTNPVTGY